jgi:hypothetical protein
VASQLLDRPNYIAGWAGLTGVSARRFTQNGLCRPLPVGSAPVPLPETTPARVRWSTLGYVEKVRPQFLSLRHDNALSICFNSENLDDAAFGPQSGVDTLRSS